MKRLFTLLLLASYTFSACTTQKTPTQTVSVYATSSAQLWLADVYECAGNNSITVKIEPNEPDIYLQLSTSLSAILPTYQIGEEEILIVMNNAISVDRLSLADARGLFTQGNPSAQVWVFSAGEDIQRAFDQLALSGSRVTSTARVASGVEQMSAMLNSQSNAVGILPKRAVTGNLRAVYSVGTIPVLAITKKEPQGAVSLLIGCLQR